MAKSRYIDYDNALDVLDEAFCLADDIWQHQSELFKTFMSEGRKTEAEVRDFVGVLVDQLSSDERLLLRPSYRRS